MILGLSYWVFPLFAACVWFATLLAMLLTWITEGSPHYASMDANQHIAYISDVGAQGLKPLFIAGSTVMVVVFDFSFISERWLRHKGRLAHNTSWVQKGLSICSIVAAIIGAIGLILLTIFDTLRHPHLHDGFLVVFIAGYVISAIFICAEYQRLGIHYREHRVLRMSFWFKLAFIFVEVGLAIGFGVTSYRSHRNTAAILEWIIALIYIFYVLSFVIDFLPAIHSKHNRFPSIEMGANDVNSISNTGGPVYTDNYSNSSAQPMQQTYYASGNAPPQLRAEDHVPPSRNF